MINPIEEAKTALSSIIEKAYKSAVLAGELPEASCGKIVAEIPRDAANGDLCTTFAMTMAKALRMPPSIIAETINRHADLSDSYFSGLFVAGAYINAVYAPCFYNGVLETVERMGDSFGAVDIGGAQKVMVEFVSANPTGPMTIGNARGGVVGDSLAAVLERAGYDVTREFYLNDEGNQVALFGKSIDMRYIQHFCGEDAIEFPEDGYHGDDIRELARELAEKYGDRFLNEDEAVRRSEFIKFGLETNIARIKRDLERYRVNYDVWFPESSLHKSGFVADTVELMKTRGYTYEKEGALWLDCSKFGVDKDEVLVRSDGFYSYYAVDIAYHRNKFEVRGFDRVIDALGSDHHGHTVRFRPAMQAIGVDPERLDFLLYQFVNLIRDGEIVKMSKRTGRAITLSDLLDEIPVDAARFVFNSRDVNTRIDFDMELAIKQESENPVYYVQYAHARICSMVKLLAGEGLLVPAANQTDCALLTLPEEKSLLKLVASLPQEITAAARDYEPSRMIRYLTELAASFHAFYNAAHIRGAEPRLAAARLKLADSARSVLFNVLTMLKITAPEKM